MGKPGFTLWLTGLSGAGKSTLAENIARELRRRGSLVEVLDGDAIRHSPLSAGLGFSKPDRDIHVRRIGFLSNMLSRNGVIAIVATISPYKETRNQVRRMQASGRFVEVFVDCPLEVLVKRDVKQLYQRALNGELPGFTGISDVYEAPDSPDIHVQTADEAIEQSVSKILRWLEREGCI